MTKRSRSKRPRGNPTSRQTLGMLAGGALGLLAGGAVGSRAVGVVGAIVGGIIGYGMSR